MALENGRDLRGHFRDMSQKMCNFINVVRDIFNITVVLESRAMGRFYVAGVAVES